MVKIIPWLLVYRHDFLYSLIRNEDFNEEMNSGGVMVEEVVPLVMNKAVRESDVDLKN